MYNFWKFRVFFLKRNTNNFHSYTNSKNLFELLNIEHIINTFESSYVIFKQSTKFIYIKLLAWGQAQIKQNQSTRVRAHKQSKKAKQMTRAHNSSLKKSSKSQQKKLSLVIWQFKRVLEVYQKFGLISHKTTINHHKGDIILSEQQ